jgi:DNA repair exonuclease SbcCD ATPase subunit
MSATDLLSRVQQRRREIDFKRGQQQSLQERATSLQADISELTETAAILDRVTLLLNSIGEDKQQQAQEQIEGIITRGLQTIFGDTFSFHIAQTMKGKSASVEFFIRTHLDDTAIETPVLESHGGGLAAIVGFMLRVTVMLLDKSEDKAKVIILDETFGMVSDEYLDPLAEFIRDLVDKTDIQVILVTHQPEWSDYADKTVRFGIKNGSTFVRSE